jgi:putative polymerase
LVLLAIVIGAMCFNLALCFANTIGVPVSNVHVIAAEMLIVSVVLVVSYPSATQVHLLLFCGIVLYTLTVASLRVVIGTDGTIDVKIVRDLLIPITFFVLGLRVRDTRDADLVVGVAAAIVLILGVFEFVWVDGYTKVFNVAKYYIARGTMEARDALQSADLFVSGMRPAGAEGGRNLLPFLGDHRVSSVFLEPVSTGNFGVIVFTWALVRSKFEGKIYLGLMTAGLALIVLADSRFGAYLCVITLVIVMLPPRLVTLGMMLMPLLALFLLTFVVPVLITGSYDPQRRYLDNGVVGRLVLSGRMLGDFDVLNWMGLKPARVLTFDSGYAYIVSGIGALGLGMLWYLFMGIPGPNRQFYEFRNMAALYYGAILCISNSPFTIKTASLLWFLIGALSRGSARPFTSAPPNRPASIAIDPSHQRRRVARASYRRPNAGA